MGIQNVEGEVKTKTELATLIQFKSDPLPLLPTSYLCLCIQ